MYVVDRGHRDSVVSVVSRLWAGRDKRYFSFPKSPDWLSRAHLVPYSAFTVVVSWRCSGWGCDLDLSPPSNTEVKNESDYIWKYFIPCISHIRYLIGDTYKMHT